MDIAVEGSHMLAGIEDVTVERSALKVSLKVSFSIIFSYL